VRALIPDDPEALGGHRLLARLGAGGMGVVYLARTPGGALVALKVIRAEHAADPRFRTRFRREVTAARRLRGRWLVPVVAADAEAREPWLATEFVPGPTLTETVDGYGPWPVPAVARLGGYLARTLADVHRAGLVHRDVKPGNVLLTLDGPRLIDFGIARAPGATALTASGVVVGTPGYLAPEQAATGAGEVGPAADVFALGCVLAFAASGRRPFGTGHPAAVVFRTVNEAPDLSGVPEGTLRGWIERCLRKTPEERPTAAELADGLAAGPAGGAEARSGGGEEPVGPGAGDGPGSTVVERAGTVEAGPGAAGEPRPAAGGAAGDPPARGSSARDEPGSSADGSAGPAGRQAGGGPGARPGGPAGGSAVPEPADSAWLPPDVLRVVAERSARALDIPAPLRDSGATASDRPEPATRPAGSAPVPTRRRFLAVGGAAVIAAGGGLFAYARTRGSGPTDPGPPVRTLGLHADLSGPGKDTGRAHERAARLAVERHNARDHAAFLLALEVADDGGDAARAARVARRFADDVAVLAVLGPTTAVSASAGAGVYRAARLGAVLVAVDGAGVPQGDGDALCVTRAPEELLPAALLHYLADVHPTSRTAVVRDEGRAAWDFAGSFVDNPPGGGTVTVHDTDDGITAAVDAALAARAQAVVYAGTSPDRAAHCARALAAADFTGPRGGTRHTLTPAFLRAAGAAAEGWLAGAPFSDPAAARDFAAAYRDAYGAAPPRWAPEAYDAVGLAAAAMGRLGGGVERGALGPELFRSTYRGVAKDLRFAQDATHQLRPEGSLFLYQARDGEFAFLGPYDEVRRA
jgi:ABC-type branched-subunit amino acid transport system substrate-binding protein